MIIVDNINAYCAKNELSIKRFEQHCGIANGVVGKWANHGAVPQVATIIKIQDATGIPAGKWLDENGLD